MDILFYSPAATRWSRQVHYWSGHFELHRYPAGHSTAGVEVPWRFLRLFPVSILHETRISTPLSF